MTKDKTVTMSRELAQKVDDLLYIMTGHDSYPRLIHKYGKEWWTPINEMRAEICTIIAAPSCGACNDTGRMHEPGCDPGDCSQCAAPVVERQPVAWEYKRKDQSEFGKPTRHVSFATADLEECRTGKNAEGRVVLTPRDDYFDWRPLAYASPRAPVAFVPEAMPITESMDRLMEAYRLGEFRLEGGSPTVEAMSCKSFDENADAVRDHDFDSYTAGYQAAMYEQARSLLGHIACLDKVKELHRGAESCSTHSAAPAPRRW